MNHSSVSESVRNYYGQVLSSSQDLKTSACCSLESAPHYLRPLLADLHPQVVAQFYGCGAPFPPALKGATVLDLGCGTGRDCFLLSRLVGELGQVIGVDMTAEQLAVAHQYDDWHKEKYAYEHSNIHFKQGYIEDLQSAGIADDSVDVVVSNCVVNLSPDKRQVFKEIFRVLKPGGELYFSDVYADRRIPEHLRFEPVLLGECLSGALYWEDFRRILMDLGCADFRIVNSSPIALEDDDIIEKIGMAQFRSVTIRAFKMPLEDRCEDYGQIATYLGSMKNQPHAFDLDDHHHFETGRPLRVCGNSFDMLALSRYAPHFQLIGDKSNHFGLFDCAEDSSTKTSDGAACC